MHRYPVRYGVHAALRTEPPFAPPPPRRSGTSRYCLVPRFLAPVWIDLYVSWWVWEYHIPCKCTAVAMPWPCHVTHTHALNRRYSTLSPCGNRVLLTSSDCEPECRRTCIKRAVPVLPLVNLLVNEAAGSTPRYKDHTPSPVSSSLTSLYNTLKLPSPPYTILSFPYPHLLPSLITLSWCSS